MVMMKEDGWKREKQERRIRREVMGFDGGLTGFDWGGAEARQGFWGGFYSEQVQWQKPYHGVCYLIKRRNGETDCKNNNKMLKK